MTETTDAAMTTPASYGDAPLPKRNGYKGLMPGSWIGRGVSVEYRDGDGQGQSTSGKLLDWTPVGIILGANGCRTLLSWDALVLCELEPDG